MQSRFSHSRGRACLKAPEHIPEQAVIQLEWKSSSFGGGSMHRNMQTGNKYSLFGAKTKTHKGDNSGKSADTKGPLTSAVVVLPFNGQQR